MKKTMVMLAAAALLASAVPAMAMTQADGNCLQDCRTMAKNCGSEVDSLPQRIQKLQAAIRDHADSYSADELRKLEDRLVDAQATLASLLHR